MDAFEKIYIGKGKKVENMDIVFEVARMKVADNYGRSHTVYYSKKNEVAKAPKKGAKKTRKLKKLEEHVDLPY